MLLAIEILDILPGPVHVDSLLSQRSARALLSSAELLWAGAAAGPRVAGAADSECSLIGYTGYNNISKAIFEKK